MFPGNDFLSEMMDSLKLLLDSIDSVVVYKAEALLARQIVLDLKKQITESSLSTKDLDYSQMETFADLQNAAENLKNALTAISEQFWAACALDMSIYQPIEDLQNFMEQIIKYGKALKFKIADYHPTQENMIQDISELYVLFNQALSINEKARARFDSCKKYLEDHKAPLPKLPEKPAGSGQSEIANIFESFEYLVNHNDFVKKQTIGSGATSYVYLGERKDCPGQLYAIKELKNEVLDPYEIQSLRRELNILSSFHNSYLIKFVGATCTPPYWVITEYMPGKSLYTRIRDHSLTNPVVLTKLAFQVAIGMEYIHSRDYIHRDLKTLNILLDSAGDNPNARICDFGISRKVSADQLMTATIGTYNYMAPEVVTSSAQYGQPADVFSFGMMLCEMVNREVPFKSVRDGNQIAQSIIHGIRPALPRTTPQPLVNLIEDCWQGDPSLRPTFVQIIYRMQSEQICFRGASPLAIQKMYEQLAEEASMVIENPYQSIVRPLSETLPSKEDIDTTIFNLLKEQKYSNLRKVLQQNYQNRRDNPEFFASLKEKGFVEGVIPHLLDIPHPHIFTRYLVIMIDSPDEIMNFKETGGVSLIRKLLLTKSSNAMKGGFKLFRHIFDYLSPDDCRTLISPILRQKKFKVAARIITTKQSDDYAPEIKPHLQDILTFKGSKKYRIRILSYFVQNGKIPLKYVSLVSPTVLLLLNSSSFAHKICRFNSFTQNIKKHHVKKIIKEISRKSRRARIAALMASTFPDHLIDTLVQDSNFVNNILSIKDISCSINLLMKISARKEGSYQILQNTQILQNNNPRIIALFIRIAGFYPKETSENHQLIDYLISNIGSMDNLEATIRVFGSMIPYVPSSVDFEMQKLLMNTKLSPIERHVLLLYFYRNSSFKPNEYQQKRLLQIIRQNSEEKVAALALYLRSPIPSNEPEIINILFEIALSNKAANNLIIFGINQLLNNKEYKRMITLRCPDELTKFASNIVDNADGFISLMKIVIEHHLSLTTDIFTSFEYALDNRRLKLSEEKRNIIKSLRRTISSYVQQ